MRSDYLRTCFSRSTLLITLVMASSASGAEGQLQNTLSAPQVTAIRNELSGALIQINARRYPSVSAKEAAIVAAIEQVAVTDIHFNGIETAGAVTSAIIAITASNGISPSDDGNALGKSAVQISTCNANADAINCASARQIAQAVANEGTAVMVDAFVNAVSGAGGSSELASVALGVPQVTAAIPGSVAGHRYGNYLPPSPPPACGNPSCT